MDKFSSELWFEPEPPRTEPEVQFKVLQHQENGRPVFGHLWCLWGDVKTPKTKRHDVFEK